MSFIISGALLLLSNNATLHDYLPIKFGHGQIELHIYLSPQDLVENSLLHCKTLAANDDDDSITNAHYDHYFFNLNEDTLSATDYCAIVLEKSSYGAIPFNWFIYLNSRYNDIQITSNDSKELKILFGYDMELNQVTVSDHYLPITTSSIDYQSIYLQPNQTIILDIALFSNNLEKKLIRASQYCKSLQNLFKMKEYFFNTPFLTTEQNRRDGVKAIPLSMAINQYSYWSLEYWLDYCKVLNPIIITTLKTKHYTQSNSIPSASIRNYRKASSILDTSNGQVHEWPTKSLSSCNVKSVRNLNLSTDYSQPSPCLVDVLNGVGVTLLNESTPLSCLMYGMSLISPIWLNQSIATQGSSRHSVAFSRYQSDEFHQLMEVLIAFTESNGRILKVQSIYKYLSDSSDPSDKYSFEKISSTQLSTIHKGSLDKTVPPPNIAVLSDGSVYVLIFLTEAWQYPIAQSIIEDWKESCITNVCHTVIKYLIYHLPQPDSCELNASLANQLTNKPSIRSVLLSSISIIQDIATKLDIFYILFGLEGLLSFPIPSLDLSANRTYFNTTSNQSSTVNLFDYIGLELSLDASPRTRYFSKISNETILEVQQHINRDDAPVRGLDVLQPLGIIPKLVYGSHQVFRLDSRLIVSTDLEVVHGVVGLASDIAQLFNSIRQEYLQDNDHHDDDHYHRMTLQSPLITIDMDQFAFHSLFAKQILLEFSHAMDHFNCSLQLFDCQLITILEFIRQQRIQSSIYNKTSNLPPYEAKLFKILFEEIIQKLISDLFNESQLQCKEKETDEYLLTMQFEYFNYCSGHVFGKDVNCQTLDMMDDNFKKLFKSKNKPTNTCIHQIQNLNPDLRVDSSMMHRVTELIDKTSSTVCQIQHQKIVELFDLFLKDFQTPSQWFTLVFTLLLSIQLLIPCNNYSKYENAFLTKMTEFGKYARYFNTKLKLPDYQALIQLIEVFKTRIIHEQLCFETLVPLLADGYVASSQPYQRTLTLSKSMIDFLLNHSSCSHRRFHLYRIRINVENELELTIEINSDFSPKLNRVLYIANLVLSSLNLEINDLQGMEASQLNTMFPVSYRVKHQRSARWKEEKIRMMRDFAIHHPPLSRRGRSTGKMHFITFASKKTPELINLLSSAKFAGIDLQVLGLSLGERYTGYQDKLRHYHEYLMMDNNRSSTVDIHDDDIVVLMDGYDVLLYPVAKDNIPEVLVKSAAPIIFCGENGIYLEFPNAFMYPRRSTGSSWKHKFLNSGCIAGRAGSMRDMFETIEPWIDILRDDQQIFVRYYQDNPDMVRIDEENELFVTSFKENGNMADFRLFPDNMSLIYQGKDISLLHCNNKGSNGIYDGMVNYMKYIWNEIE